jgi:hypothetical protein
LTAWLHPVLGLNDDEVLAATPAASDKPNPTSDIGGRPRPHSVSRSFCFFSNFAQAYNETGIKNNETLFYLCIALGGFATL